MAISPCPGAQATEEREKTQRHTSIFPIPDDGYLSNDNHFVYFHRSNLNDRYAQGITDKVELYLYALALRYQAVRNILEATKFTRAIGMHLGIDPDLLTAIPSNLKNNFRETRFKHMAKSIQAIEAANFIDSQGLSLVSNDRFEELVRNLAKKAVAVMELKMSHLNAEIMERKNVEDNYTKNRGLLFIPGFYRHELEGYPQMLSDVQAKARELKDKLEEASSELFLYLPFYKDNWLKNAWASATSSLKPSFIFSDLLIATMFWECIYSPRFDKREDLAKWLNSGIHDGENFIAFCDFYASTARYREMILKDTIPDHIHKKVREALKKAIEKSILFQNETLEFLADSKHVVSKERDYRIKSDNHGKTYSAKAYEQLPGRLAFLSDFPGLKKQIQYSYCDDSELTFDKINVLHHTLEKIYASQNGGGNRRLPIARAGALAVSLFVPGGVLAVMAVLALPEAVNIVSSLRKSACLNRQSDVLLSLYDAQYCSFENETEATIADYNHWIKTRDGHRQEAYNSVSYGIFQTALMGTIIGKVANPVLRSALVSLFSNPSKGSAVKSSIILAAAAFYWGHMIKNLSSNDEDPPKPIVENKRATAALSDSMAQSRLNERIEYAYTIILNSFGEDPDPIGLTDFLLEHENDKSGIIVPNDHGKTFILDLGKSIPRVYMDFSFLTEDSTTPQNLAFEIAYYYYLYRTTSFVEESIIKLDQGFEILGGQISGEDLLKDLEEISQRLDWTPYPVLDRALRGGLADLFTDALSYAEKAGGIRAEGRKYFDLNDINF